MLKGKGSALYDKYFICAVKCLIFQGTINRLMLLLIMKCSAKSLPVKLANDQKIGEVVSNNRPFYAELSVLVG